MSAKQDNQKWIAVQIIFVKGVEMVEAVMIVPDGFATMIDDESFEWVRETLSGVFPGERIQPLEANYIGEVVLQ
jgi:hypothetical protein